jgi:small subunit ribosomal protein S17
MAVTKKTETKKEPSSKPATPAKPQQARGLRKRQEGMVVSNKMEKTVVVAVVRQVRHATYGKFVRRTKKFYAHDESKQCGIGDRVRIVETRPISKLKCWKVEAVITKAE